MSDIYLSQRKQQQVTAVKRRKFFQANGYLPLLLFINGAPITASATRSHILTDICVYKDEPVPPHPFALSFTYCRRLAM